MLAEPRPSSDATTQPARTIVPHSAGATVANCRGFMSRSLHLSQPSQPSDGADCLGQDVEAQWRKSQVVIFFRNCCSMATCASRRFRRKAALSGKYKLDCSEARKLTELRRPVTERWLALPRGMAGVPG